MTERVLQLQSYPAMVAELVPTRGPAPGVLRPETPMTATARVTVALQNLQNTQVLKYEVCMKEVSWS